MPVFEYRCQACGKRTEDLVLAGDMADYVPECSHCGSHDLSRLLSAFAAHGGDKGAASLDGTCGMGACETGEMSQCGMGGCGMGGGDFDLN